MTSTFEGVILDVMPQKVESKNKKSLVFSVLILSLLILGLLVSTKLVSVRQLFSPKALTQEIEFLGDNVTTTPFGQVTSTSPTVQIKLTSPYSSDSVEPKTNQRPIFEDNFEGVRRLPQGRIPDVGNIYAYRNYTNNAYEILINQDTSEGFRSLGYQAAVYKSDIPRNEWSAVFDGSFSENTAGKINIGIVFGGNEFECDYRGTSNCYHYHLENDGRSYLVKQTFHEGYKKNGVDYAPYNDSVEVYSRRLDLRTGLEDKNLTFRFDKSVNRISGWVKVDGSWISIIDTSIDSGYNGRAFGVLLGRPGDDGRTARGSFDNLKVFALGDLPEPGSSIGLQYRYSFTQGDIEGDPEGFRVLWQPMDANPITITQTFTSDSSVKLFFVQFKNGDQTSETYQGTFELNIPATND